MIKTHKRALILSSLATLLPIALGLLLWDRLPEQMATHWGADGLADGWSSRAVAVFLLPLILLPVHWLCLFVTAKDPGNKGQSRKVFGLIFWLCPVISLLANGMVYASALNLRLPLLSLVCLMGCALFVAVGNYLPKCRQNHTIGIKVKWTLENEENWNVTHRLAGKLWVGMGLALGLYAFLPESAALLLAPLTLLAGVMIPVAYSYAFHRRQVKLGTASAAPQPQNQQTALITRIALALTAVLLVFVGVLMFSGDVEVTCGETAFTVRASYWADLTVDYAAVDHMEYRQADSKGARTYGYASPRLLAGTFQNEEFGSYTRYSYTRCDACIVLTAQGRTLVLSGPDEEQTQALYQQIKARLG